MLRRLEVKNCQLVIEKFLTEEMQLSHQHIYSPQNIFGEVRIDVAHRVRKTSSNPRPIVTKFVTRHGKESVLKQAKNLRGKKYFVREQLPSKMKEHRLAQNDTLKQLREKHPDKKTHNIRFTKDKLLMNSQVVPHVFERNPLPIIKVVPWDYDRLAHSDEITVAVAPFVHSIEDAVRARDALFQDLQVASADQMMYAYHVDNEHGVFVTGNFDDGEVKGSQVKRFDLI